MKNNNIAMVSLLIAVFGYGLSFVLGFANMVAEEGMNIPRPFSPYLIFTCLMVAGAFMVLWVWLSEKSEGE